MRTDSIMADRNIAGKYVPCCIIFMMELVVVLTFDIPGDYCSKKSEDCTVKKTDSLVIRRNRCTVMKQKY